MEHKKVPYIYGAAVREAFSILKKNEKKKAPRREPCWF